MAPKRQYILGIDLGVSSLGWAMLEANLVAEAWRPVSVIDAGVRIFEAGVEGDVEQGKDSSRGAERRLARQPRRQLWRRQQRKRNLFRLLQRLELLPPSPGNRSEDRTAVLTALDRELAATWLPPGDILSQQKLPYLIRAAGLTKPLKPYELGRALYHLVQRRGYQTNRKSAQEDSDGSVATGIGALAKAMGDKTLGQFFAEDVDVFKHAKLPDGTRDHRTGRILRRYTARKMYKDEFLAIRDQQRQTFPHLTDDQWKALELAIFFQRPLKSQRRLVGHCSIDRTQRRCLEALPIYQEFRILQTVNHLIVRLPDGSERPLSAEERAELITHLQTAGSIKLTEARKKAGLPKGAKFTIEEWEENLPGHRTNQKMITVFGDHWLELPLEARDQIVREVVYYRKELALKKRGLTAWGLNDEQAERLTQIQLEEGYGGHCRKVLTRLVAAMQDGTPYAQARQREYPESFETGKVFERLPPVDHWDREIRNPAVMRALTEVRKVVNALIRKHGVPAVIRIELARDLKNSREKRRRLWQQNQENRKRREKAAKAIVESLQNENLVTRTNVDKWLYADECNWECPYCGRGIEAMALIGAHPQFDIEHIFPRRYLDNSQANKTLACRECNHQKGNRLPAQAFDAARLEEILDRVQRFPEFSRVRKLDRFKQTEVTDDFVQRDLNDTRYNSRQAANYLANLYGGRSDAHQTQRIYTLTGGLTALLRKAWDLNAILSGTDEKTRDDHRHHAIDAVIAAISDPTLVSKLSTIAQQFERKTERERAFLSGLEEPWDGFRSQVRDVIARMHVSHRATRTLAGPLHAESLYSKPHEARGAKEFRIRKELTKLSAKEIEGEQIVDPHVRQLVQAKFRELGGGLPSKVFADVKTHPALPNAKGEPVPIHRVRIRVDAKPRLIGEGPRERYVASGKDSNFASMVYAVLDKSGKETKWVHEIVDRLTAHERLSANRKRPGEKVLLPDEQAGKRRFKFALLKNDMVLLQGPHGTDELYRVQKLSANEIQLCEHNRTTVGLSDRTPWNRISSLDTLRRRNAQKVRVTPDGEIILAQA